MPIKKTLNARERYFCQFLARGVGQGVAWQRAIEADTGEIKELTNSLRSQASQKAKQPWIVEHLERLLDNAAVTDIDSIGQAYNDMRDLLKKAENKENYNAAAQLTRLRLQAIGALKNEVYVQSSIDDKILIDRLANGDPVKIAALKEMLTPDSFEEETETTH